MKSLLAVLIILCFYSCSKREDFLLNANKPAEAEITLLNQHSSYSATFSENGINDTLKLGYYYRFNFNITDERETVHLKYTSSGGTMFMDGVEFVESDVVIGEHTFEWFPDTTGFFQFQLELKDGYDSITTKAFNINVFENYTPVVTWVLTESPMGGLTKKIIVYGDDSDQLYGGNIIGYEYVINGNGTEYTENEFLYTFPSPGTYSISVRAKDNNNQWGDYYTIDNYVIL